MPVNQWWLQENIDTPIIFNSQYRLCVLPVYENKLDFMSYIIVCKVLPIQKSTIQIVLDTGLFTEINIGMKDGRKEDDEEEDILC